MNIPDSISPATDGELKWFQKEVERNANSVGWTVFVVACHFAREVERLKASIARCPNCGHTFDSSGPPAVNVIYTDGGQLVPMDE